LFDRRIVTVLFVCLSLISASCGETPEARLKSAQPTAEKYFEYIKASDYTGAYRNTFSKAHRAQLDLESFNIYRTRLAATTGKLVGVTLVETKDNADIGRVRLVYALQSESHPAAAPTEILDLEREDGEWKISAVDFKLTKPEEQQKKPEGIPLPGFKGEHKTPAQPPSK
jgi:hypothetical protein